MCRNGRIMGENLRVILGILMFFFRVNGCKVMILNDLYERGCAGGCRG